MHLEYLASLVEDIVNEDDSGLLPHQSKIMEKKVWIEFDTTHINVHAHPHVPIMFSVLGHMFTIHCRILYPIRHDFCMYIYLYMFNVTFDQSDFNILVFIV